MDEHTDFIATELLKELKESNERKDTQIVQMHHNYMHTIYGFLIAISAIVAGFLLYLNQYDFTSTSEYSYETNGVYALVDSEGNVVAQDLTSEEIDRIMEVLGTNGDGESVGPNDQIED